MIELFHGDCLDLMKDIPDKSNKYYWKYNNEECKMIIMTIDELYEMWKKNFRPESKYYFGNFVDDMKRIANIHVY
jgi:hypothetical protein